MACRFRACLGGVCCLKALADNTRSYGMLVVCMSLWGLQFKRKNGTGLMDDSSFMPFRAFHNPAHSMR